MLYLRILCWVLGGAAGILWVIYWVKKNKIKTLRNTSGTIFASQIIAVVVLYFLSSEFEKNYLEKIIGNTIIVVAGLIGVWGMIDIIGFREKIVSLNNKKEVPKEIKEEFEKIYKIYNNLNITVLGLVLFIFSLIWLLVIRNT